MLLMGERTMTVCPLYMPQASPIMQYLEKHVCLGTDLLMCRLSVQLISQWERWRGIGRTPQLSGPRKRVNFDAAKEEAAMYHVPPATANSSSISVSPDKEARNTLQSISHSLFRASCLMQDIG
jgi:hypothetical protein